MQPFAYALKTRDSEHCLSLSLFFPTADPAAEQPLEEHRDEGAESPKEDEYAEEEEDDKDQAQYPTVRDTTYRDLGILFPLESGRLVFDVDGSLGQARPFNVETYMTRLEEFRSALPTTPLKVTLWPMDPHGVLQRGASPDSHFSHSQIPNLWCCPDNTVRRVS